MVGIENGGFNFEPMGDSMGNPKFYALKSLIFPIEIARTGCPIGSTALLNCNFCCWWPQMLVPNFLTRHFGVFSEDTHEIFVQIPIFPSNCQLNPAIFVA